MQMRQIKIATAVLLLVTAGAILGARYHHPQPQLEPRPHIGIGQALAERAAKMVAGNARITLMAPDTRMRKFPGPAIEIQALHAALQRANLRISATNVVKIDPNRVLRAPSFDFADILRKHGESDVVVSLLGPPVLNPEHKARVGEKRPKVIALCSGNMPRQVNLKALFAENLLHAAIVSRPNPSATLPTSENPADWFDHFYMWVTPQDAATLPEPVRK